MAPPSPSPAPSNPSQTITFSDPRPRRERFNKGSEQAARITLDSRQRRNIRNLSHKLGPILKIDREEGKWKSRFIDWDNRCGPSTTRMVTKLLAENGDWPAEAEKRGLELVQIYVGFQVFECHYPILERSDGFISAAKHLIFCMDPEKIPEKDAGLYALTQGLQGEICCDLKASYDRAMADLEQQSSQWANRIRNELESQGYLDVLRRVGHRRERCPTPLELNRIIEIINRTLKPPTMKLVPRGGRAGGIAIAGAVEGVLERLAGEDDDDAHSIASSIGPPDPLEDFKDALQHAFGDISDRAYTRFVRRLRGNWEEKMGPRMAMASSSSVPRNSAVELHSDIPRRRQVNATSRRDVWRDL